MHLIHEAATMSGAWRRNDPAAYSGVPTLDGLLGSTHRVWFPHIFFTPSLKLALETTDIMEENHRRRASRTHRQKGVHSDERPT
jgi:hypothetical protein